MSNAEFEALRTRVREVPELIKDIQPAWLKEKAGLSLLDAAANFSEEERIAFANSDLLESYRAVIEI